MKRSAVKGTPKRMYGKTPKSGHGRRLTTYLWTPSNDPSRPRRPYRKKRRNLKWHRALRKQRRLERLQEGRVDRRTVQYRKRCVFTAKDIDLVDILLRSPALEECPDIEAAWNAARRVDRAPDAGILAAQVRFGMMLLKQEKSTDFTARRQKNGTILGRGPGLRGWIQRHCPALLPHYKSLMAHKAAVKKLCKLLGIDGPVAANKVAGIRKTCREMFQEGIPVSLTSLEITTRLKLGMVWMRRRKRPHPEAEK